ncbi:hypothetical protein [Glaesserella parasuis]|uniref:hypothetical protein n=1 Tax=Glaesserella parasuis TaxID=738 RepID=UPI002436CE9E|nr:hypothetical protein [Glaesserella parasuis]
MDTGLKPRTIPLLISNSYAFPNNKETPFNGKDLPLEKYKQYEFPNASQVFFKIKNNNQTLFMVKLLVLVIAI